MVALHKYLALPVLVGMVACTPQLTTIQTTTWLEAKPAKADMDVSGRWDSGQYMVGPGWGAVQLAQDGSKVMGSIGLYNVEGRVRGQQLYLVLFSGNKAYYTVILDKTKPGELSGMAYSRAIADAPTAHLAERSPMVLTR